MMVFYDQFYCLTTCHFYLSCLAMITEMCQCDIITTACFMFIIIFIGTSQAA